ncbi:MAG: class I lanthipeptide [Thermoanaerobaculia bacterium]
MRKQTTKLTLNRETLRRLEVKELENAKGGLPIVTSGEATYGTQCLTLQCD